MTTFDFQDGNGPVPAHQHVNPDGSQGGWVAETASVESTVYIGPDAKVYGKARVYGSAEVYGEARVYGSAWVYGKAEVSGSAGVYGSARVYGSAKIYGKAWVSGSAWVFGSAQISGEAMVSGSAQVSRSAIIQSRDDIVHGYFHGYTYTAYKSENNIILQYGCESQTLEYWKLNLKELCKKHDELGYVELLKKLFLILED